MQFSPRDIVVLFAGFLGILLAAYLLRHPGANKRASQWLASFLLLQGVLLVVSVFLYRHILYWQWEYTFRSLFYLESTLLMLDGLLLYGYCSVLLLNRTFSWRTLSGHLAFIGTAAAVSLAVYLHNDVLSYFNPTAETRSAATGFAYCAVQAVRAGYALLCLRLIQVYKTRMAAQFSNLQQRNVAWVFAIIKGFAGFRLGWLLLHSYFTAAALHSWDMLNYKWLVGGALFLLDFSWLLVTLALLYFGLRYSPSFMSLAMDSTEPNVKRNESDPKLIHKLEQAMAQQQLFNQPELRLDDIARNIGYASRVVSNAINDHYHTNFCDFINRYRVEHAKHLLASEQGMSVLDISLASGFNSKSAFNRAFKSLTGVTPGNYRKQLTPDVASQQ